MMAPAKLNQLTVIDIVVDLKGWLVLSSPLN